MITLTVTSYNGKPADAPLSATFDELGGTIGRADHNQLVLPDPERTVSRVHAQVVYRNGRFAVLDRGSNPVVVDGKALGNGREAPIADGTELRIGGYLLGVRQATAPHAAPGSSADDPFADLFGPAPTVARKPAPMVDPLAAFGTEPPARARGAQASPAARPSAAAAPAAGGIPEDWDPFAPDPASRKMRVSDFARDLGQERGSLGLDGGAAAPAPLIPDLGPQGVANDSIDNLFGLGGAGAGGDPLANSLLEAPMAGPNMAAAADPMRALNSAPKATSASAADNLSDLNRPFIQAPMVARPPAAGDASTLPPHLREPTHSRGESRPSNAVMSWDDPDTTSHTVIRPGARRAGPPSAPMPLAPSAPPAKSASAPLPAPSAPAPPPARPAPSAAGRAAVAPAAASSPRPVPPTSMQRPAMAAAPPPARSGLPSSADAAALVAAFREGLATPSVQLDVMTPELMRLIGELLRESARGTVELLVARAAVKREVRAAATMIVARENNPLKFSPSGDAALAHLLAPPVQGFMPAAPAMRDAYDDLKAHQIAFVAGMRAALEGVLGRFDPAQLESKLTQRSFLGSLVPGSRQARMWEAFVQLYSQIRSEASDDFHALFGKEFLKAYEDHVDKLKEGAR